MGRVSWLAVSLLLWSSLCWAKLPADTLFQTPPKRRVLLQNLFVFRLNPVGIEDQLRVGYQHRLLDRDSVLLRDTFVFAGAALRLNPGFAKIGPQVEVQPLSLLSLRFSAEYVGYFSSFGFLQSFPSPVENYNDRLLRTNQDAGTNYSTQGFHFLFEPMIQAKLGPIALRNKLSVEYWYMNVRSPGTTFYEVTLDTLVPKNGWVIANDLDLLYVHPNPRYRFVLGARYSVVKPLYSDADYRSTDDRNLENNEHHRVGPFFAYTFFDKGFTRFNKPTLIVILNWYVDSRYRTGAEASTIVPGVYAQSGGIPYVILGFAFQSDFLKTVVR